MDNIIIEKVINNNIISAYEKSGAEVIVMGRGIGFKKKQGEVVPADQISKIFRIKSRTLTEQFKELLANMPLERVRISDEIISHAKDHLKLKLNQSIYLWCYRAVRIWFHVPGSWTLCYLCIIIWYLYICHSIIRIPCRLFILSRCNRPSVLRISACSTENMADHSSGNRSIYRILCSIQICNP